ncbi:MAG: phosphomethylpyrimidine synthase ThiC [Candidatus Omnitrophota bacterium]
MTRLDLAKSGKITGEMKRVAKFEHTAPEIIRDGIAKGKIVIPLNKNHKISKICAIGKGLRTKVNVNIGTSTDKLESADELKKLQIAIKYGTDTVMDLSIGGNLVKILNKIIDNSTVPVGTVPIYEAAVNARRQYGSILKMTVSDILNVIKRQARIGVDFFTIHCGINKKSINSLKNNRRILDIVSRGGAILAAWMSYRKRENPMFEYFDEILEIAREFDVTLSLGDALRPGSILDATDYVQIEELKTLGILAKRAKNRGVQVIIEGPGHVPLNQIKKNIQLEKKLCHGAPFYVLGPLVTDIAPGYDHITASIGGSLAASFGADFLCYVTASEHLRHPSIADVKEGLISSRIAAHAADLSKGLKHAKDWDRNISLARKKRDWRKQILLSIDPEKAKSFRMSSRPKIADVCTMCGQYCSIKLAQNCLGAAGN